VRGKSCTPQIRMLRKWDRVGETAACPGGGNGREKPSKPSMTIHEIGSVAPQIEMPGGRLVLEQGRIPEKCREDSGSQAIHKRRSTRSSAEERHSRCSGGMAGVAAAAAERERAACARCKRYGRYERRYTPRPVERFRNAACGRCLANQPPKVRPVPRTRCSIRQCYGRREDDVASGIVSRPKPRPERIRRRAKCPSIFTTSRE